MNESEIFNAAVKLSGQERAMFLDLACKDDPALRKEVEGLLKAHDDSQSFRRDSSKLAQRDRALAMQETLEPGTNDSAGTIIAGKYKLLDKPIGEGGMGTVWLAEQREPVKRLVAIKLIKTGMDSKAVLARFEAERSALALMDHPNVARILDGGLTESGSPFFVMELVKGIPITEFCDARKLTPRQRLELFVPICQAIQHAHQKGIIHRDIKPSNVLVALYDDRPVPKVIDFGLAKATGQALTEQTLNTGFNVVGTPQYMSPEQATFNQLDIDTRSDIYSLGVLLYELLAGSPPFKNQELEKAGLLEILRVIREEEPPRPSTKVSTTAGLPSISANRGMEPKKLRGILRNELDWIVMKALEKDRSRRYETANGFAADINRYLSGEAVLAHPPSRSYRLKKFLRKHKGPVLATSLIFVALLAGIIGTAFGLLQANLQRDRAVAAEAETKKRADELQKVADFEAKMLGQIDPILAGKLLSDDVRERFDAALIRDGVSAAERTNQVEVFAGQWQRVNATDAARTLLDSTILKPAIAAIEKQFADQPVVDAQLRQVLADRYFELALYDAALPLQTSALQTRRRVLGEEHPDTLTSIGSMGALLLNLGKLSEAEPYHREALEKFRHVLGEEHASTLEGINNMGVLLMAQGKLDEAESYLREALEKRRRVLGDEDLRTVEGINRMGVLLKAQGKLDEAEPYLREALAKYRHVLGEGRPPLNSIGHLGELLLAQGKLDEAEPYLREAAEKGRRLLGDDHPVTLTWVINLGILLQAQAKHAETVELLAPIDAVSRKRFAGGNAWKFARLLMNLGKARAALGEFAAAEANLLEAQPIFVQTRDPAHKDTRDCAQALVDLYTAWHTAEPDNGYDAKAAEWKTKLDALPTTTTEPKPDEKK